MPIRFIAALAPALLALAVAPAARARRAPVPLPSTVLSGAIHFPRAQRMALSIAAHDPSRATAALGFDGRCKGGGVGELWASYIHARETVRIRHGRFKAKLTGTARHVGGVHGRTGRFKWRISGHFTDAATARATVSGTAKLRVRGHVISHCRIAGHPRVTLAL